MKAAKQSRLRRCAVKIHPLFTGGSINTANDLLDDPLRRRFADLNSQQRLELASKCEMWAEQLRRSVAFLDAGSN